MKVRTLAFRLCVLVAFRMTVFLAVACAALAGSTAPTPWINVPADFANNPCTVDALDIDATVDGLFAVVSTTITIRNPSPISIPTSLAVPLPRDAAVCGCALEIDGTMVEDEGGKIGLVETAKDSSCRTLPFRIPKNGTRRVRIDYVTPIGEIATDGGSSLPLPFPRVPVRRRVVAVKVADWTTSVSPVVWKRGQYDGAPAKFKMSRRFWQCSFTDTDVAADAELIVGIPYASGSPAVERAPDGFVYFCAAVGIAANSTPMNTQAASIVGFEGTGISDVRGTGSFMHGRGVLLGRLVADETEIRIRVRDSSGEMLLSPPITLAKNRAVAGSTLATAWAAMNVRE